MEIQTLITDEELNEIKEDVAFLKEVNGKALEEEPNDLYPKSVAQAISKIETLIKQREEQKKLDFEQEVEFWAYATLIDGVTSTIVSELEDLADLDFEDDDITELFAEEDLITKK